MDKKIPNTIVEFEFCDGSKTELTLAFYKLYQLKAKNKELYKKYMENMQKSKTDEIETMEILYTAYICAHLDDEDVMSIEDFMILCGSDRIAVQEAAYNLIRPKKQQDSVSPS